MCIEELSNYRVSLFYFDLPTVYFGSMNLQDIRIEVYSFVRARLEVEY